MAERSFLREAINKDADGSEITLAQYDKHGLKILIAPVLDQPDLVNIPEFSNRHCSILIPELTSQLVNAADKVKNHIVTSC